MSVVKQTRETKKAQRDDDLFKAYEKIIIGHGKDARNLSKASLYAEVAELFYIVPGTARNIIQKKLRNKTKNDR